VASSGVLVLPVSSYLENMALVNQSRAFVEKLARGRAEHGPHGAARGRLARAAEPRPCGWPPSSRPDISLRSAFTRESACSRRSTRPIERLVVRPLLDADGERLAAYAPASATRTRPAP